MRNPICHLPSAIPSATCHLLMQGGPEKGCPTNGLDKGCPTRSWYLQDCSSDKEGVSVSPLVCSQGGLRRATP
eukprot:11098495-Heterocapsa_arctica.AAC.1